MESDVYMIMDELGKKVWQAVVTYLKVVKQYFSAVSEENHVTQQTRWTAYEQGL
jgi:type II secretory pathway component PulK